VALAVSAALAVAGCSPTFNWREARLDDTPLAALLPCKPDRAERSVPLAGATVAMRMMGCEAGGVQFTVAVVTAPDAAQAAALMAPWRGATLANFGVAQSAGRAFTPKGAQPLPQAQLVAGTAQVDGHSVLLQAAWFVHGAQAYQALAYGRGLNAEVSETFFAGIALQ
jgi:hypothetical protein